ncbi:MAG: hypothetical protein LBJ67_02540 [Planctomycetaceae bacterium]|nr:hypothetical protein [Planctomycetaceae bacterium]
MRLFTPETKQQCTARYCCDSVFFQPISQCFIFLRLVAAGQLERLFSAIWILENFRTLLTLC